MSPQQPQSEDELLKALYLLSGQDIEPHHFNVQAGELLRAYVDKKIIEARIDEVMNWQDWIALPAHGNLKLEASDLFKEMGDRLTELKSQQSKEKSQ